MWLALSAFAHDVEGELAIRPYVRDGVLVGVYSTNGLAARNEDGTYGLVCTEALPPLTDAWLRSDGAFLLGTDEGVVAIPAGYTAYTETAVVEADVEQGEPLGLHLHNHGVNTWTFLRVTRLAR